MLYNLFPSELIILYSKRSHIYLVCIKTFPFFSKCEKDKNVPGGPFNNTHLNLKNSCCVIALQYTGNNLTVPYHSWL